MASFKRGRSLEERRRQTGVLLSKDQAATRIQSVVRGHLARTRVKQEAVQELMFVGMRPQVVIVLHHRNDVGPDSQRDT